ncbi:MAG TPA: rhomboid protease N-terminal domain-containing protein, partial [Halioglobus sp.]
MAYHYQALSAAVEEDLLPLSVLLHQHGVVHRIFEVGGRQVVMVEREEQALQVQELYRAWRAGLVRIEVARSDKPTAVLPPLTQWRLVPVTLGLIVLSVCGFLLIFLEAPTSWVSYVTFSPFRLSGDQLQFQAINGQ